MDTKHKIAVMQAFLDGKKIESRPKITDYAALMSAYVPRTMSEREWITCISEPSWNWAHTDYRVKKEPKEFLVAYREDTGKLVGLAESPSNVVNIEPVDMKLVKIKVMRVREVLE